MNSAAAKDRLERLRRFRLHPSKDLSISGEVKHLAADARRADRTLASLLDAWSNLVPQNLRSSCTPTSLRSGALVVACDSSSAAYELTRWLQEGGRQSLSRAGPPVIRVRFISPRTDSDRSPTQPTRTMRVKQNRSAGSGESKAP